MGATPPAMLVMSALAREESPRLEALRRLTALAGPLCYVSEPLVFDYSDYYAGEMGSPLTRRVAAFANLLPVHLLADFKLQCLELEKTLSRQGRREVNLDPGMLNAGSLVLASTKHRPHRMPLAAGLWSELTLLYQHGGFQALPWTYPDYATAEMRQLFQNLRGRYLWRLKGRQAPGE